MIYRHKKTGGFYTIISKEAIQESTMETAVVYQEVGNKVLWVRPYSEFFDGRFEMVAE